MISIIIPTLNEEEYLPLLLESIKRQKVPVGDFVLGKDYELILADAGSKDKTKEIAKKYGCKIVKGGLPAKGRNEGAKVAIGDLLLFIDADAVIPADFWEKAVAEFNERKLDIASFGLIPFPKRTLSKFLVNTFYNQPSLMLEDILPHAAMGILIKKELFEKLGGFDEEIKLAEDHYLARQAKKIFDINFGIIKSVKLFISDRRFKKDGWFSTGVKFFLCEIYMIFKGPVKSDMFRYKFNHYDKEDTDKNQN